jgi:hypothetical protein
VNDGQDKNLVNKSKKKNSNEILESEDKELNID